MRYLIGVMTSDSSQMRPPIALFGGHYLINGTKPPQLLAGVLFSCGHGRVRICARVRSGTVGETVSGCTQPRGLHVDRAFFLLLPSKMAGATGHEA